MQGIHAIFSACTLSVYLVSSLLLDNASSLRVWPGWCRCVRHVPRAGLRPLKISPAYSRARAGMD